jgi:peroxin-1
VCTLPLVCRALLKLSQVSLDTPTTTAALLTTDTEVSIAPKSHKKSRTETKVSSTTTIEPSAVPSTHEKPSYPSEILRVLPARLVRSSDSTTPPRDGKSRAYIHPYTLSLLTGTRYIPFDPNPNPPRSGWWCARARLLEPPKDPTDIVNSSNGNNTNAKSNAEADDGEAKVLHPGSKGEAGVKEDEGNAKDGWEVWLGISDRVLETHVVFVGEMKVEVGDWDLVRCAPLYFLVPPTFLIFD